MKISSATIICLGLILTLPLPAATIHVPADQPTIQAGIDAAVNGDIVLVADGIWAGYGNKELDFGGRAITVASEFGAAGCVVDCENLGRGFNFTGGEGPGSVVRGLTIRNGNRYSGGGIRCYSSSPTITGCVITDCTADTGGGGAIHCLDGAAPLITGNTLTNNLADTSFGGAIHVENASPVIEENTITGNTADKEGGAIHCAASTALLTGNTISNNTALGTEPFSYGGGAINVTDGCTVVLEHNTISTNFAAWKGGGIAVSSSAATIRENTIDGNQAEFRGGGIHIEFSTAEIIHNSITGNAVVEPGTVDQDGGGIFIRYGGGSVVSGNTISGNSTPNEGGGLQVNSSDECTITNNRFESNSAGRDGGGFYLYNFTGVVSDNLVANNEAGEYGGGLFTESSLLLAGMTISGNTAGIRGGGICFNLAGNCSLTDSIAWGNTAPSGRQLSYSSYSSDLLISYSAVEGGAADIFLSSGGTLTWGSGAIEDNPLFAAGPDSDYYLSQVAAGQPADSPCVDTGDPATAPPDGTTRTDGVQDYDVPDMGFHFPLITTVDTAITCVPESGTVPFTSQFSVTLNNCFTGQARQVSGRIDIETAGGLTISGWRSGYTNIAAGGQYTATWSQFIPYNQSLIGSNRFRLLAEDVTPAPFNQPPYPASGDSAEDSCWIVVNSP
jgi:putative cofactor-binding repeat protein